MKFSHGKFLRGLSPSEIFSFSRIVYSCLLLFSHDDYLIARPANVSFEHYTSENGLVSDRVSDIVQDKFGFIWIATTDGLNRFDGRTFIPYRHNEHDSTTIPDDVINALCADASGKVWVATNGGLGCYDFSVDHFTTINPKKYLAEPTDPSRVYDVWCSRNHEIWFTTRRHVHVIRVNGSIQSFSLPLANDESIGTLSENERGEILIGTNKSAVIFFDEKNNENKKINLIYNPENKSGFPGVSVTSCFPVNADSIWIPTWQGGLQLLYSTSSGYSVTAFTDEKEDAPGKWLIEDVASATSSQLWVASYGDGLSLFDINSGTFIQHFHNDPGDAKSLGSNFINKILVDASGTLWLGTNRGLDKYDPLMNQFSLLKIPEKFLSTSLRRFPNDIVEDSKDSSKLWIAVSGAGLFCYDKRTKQFQQFTHNDANKNSLVSNFIYALLIDHTGKLWIGTRDGICTYDDQKNNFGTIHCSTADGKSPAIIETMIEDHLHRIWMSSSTMGILCYTPSSNELKCYSHDETKKESLPEDYVFSVYEDHLGRIWATTQSLGLCRLNEAAGTWKNFRHTKGDMKSIPNNNVYAVTEDDNENLWVATESGLAVMNPGNENFESYFTSDGLCSNDIFNLRFDLRKHLWLSTNNGLSDFDPQKKVFKNYTTSNGLPANHLGGALYIGHDGTVYVGVPGGVNFFNPSMPEFNHRAPEVIISAFKIFGKPVSVPRNGSQLEPIHLSYEQNMIGFDFVALNFTNAISNHYKYKLEGFDHDWIDAGNKTSATYTNLDGGNYVFRVIAANNDGVWNENGATASLHISPPYWKTWWFYLLVTLAIASVLYVAYRIRINQILRLQRIRQHIARDLHDDIGSTLSSITMMSRANPKFSEQENEKPHELLQTINKASRQAMELMSDIVWSVNPVNDRFENVIIRMREYAVEILDAAGINFSLEFDPQLKTLELPMRKRKDFFLFYKEAVNNLARHSQAKNAIIQLTNRHHGLILSVADDGIGFGMNKISSGNGLKNMQSRANALNGTLNIESEIGKGTWITLGFRLSHDDGIAAPKRKKYF